MNYRLPPAARDKTTREPRKQCVSRQEPGNERFFPRSILSQAMQRMGPNTSRRKILAGFPANLQREEKARQKDGDKKLADSQRRDALCPYLQFPGNLRRLGSSEFRLEEVRQTPTFPSPSFRLRPQLPSLPSHARFAAVSTATLNSTPTA